MWRNENWHYSTSYFDPTYYPENSTEDPDEEEEYKYNYLSDEIDFED